MIQLENVSKSFPTGNLFSNVNLALRKGMRVGLVGKNGSGKTTLLKLILGTESCDSGLIKREKNASIGYLAQEIVTRKESTIIDEVLSSYPEAIEIEKEISALSYKISKNPSDVSLLNQLGDKQIEYESIGGWDLAEKAKKILSGLGFKQNQLSDTTDTLSGGWRMRVALASILLKDPDVLLLDEPTNHLDLESTIWLEKFLSKWNGIIVIISHDRTFLDSSINCVYEISMRKISTFNGNYSSYITEKGKRLDIQKKTYKNQQKEIKETERFVERFRYKSTKSKQVQSRIKKIKKIELLESPIEDNSKITLHTQKGKRLPLRVVTFNGVLKSYDNLIVLKDLDLLIKRKEKIGLVGYNGAGKTTLLKLIAGVEKATTGEIIYGNNTEIGYYAQHQLELLKKDDTVLESLSRVSEGFTELEKRTLLGSLLFSNEDIYKKVRVLSGGEKARLVWGRVLSGRPNLLLLDEPTNHLDIRSRNILEEAMINYEGSIVCISHDRHFLNKITTCTYEVGNEGVVKYDGNYDYYTWKKLSSAKIIDKKKQESSKHKEKSIVYRKEKKTKNRLATIEKQFKVIEKKLDELESILHDKKNISEHKTLMDASKKIAEYEAQYLKLIDEKDILLYKNYS